MSTQTTVLISINPIGGWQSHRLVFTDSEICGSGSQADNFIWRLLCNCAIRRGLWRAEILVSYFKIRRYALNCTLSLCVWSFLFSSGTLKSRTLIYVWLFHRSNFVPLNLNFSTVKCCASTVRALKHFFFVSVFCQTVPCKKQNPAHHRYKAEYGI